MTKCIIFDEATRSYIGDPLKGKVKIISTKPIKFECSSDRATKFSLDEAIKMIKENPNLGAIRIE